MTIVEFHLHAFGHFTDFHFDYSRMEHGIHLIYGDNEAGKSTALRGLRAALFGIPVQSPDNFLHDYERLLLGVRLHQRNGDELAFLRRKGRKNTLLTTDRQPLPDQALQVYLQGVNEEMFMMQFALDHEALVQGGENLLKDRGEVGEALYSAGLGNIDVRAALSKLEAETDELFKPNAQIPIINKSLSEWRDCKESIRRLSLDRRDYEDHLEQLKTARIARETVVAQLTAMRQDDRRLERIQKALPWITERKQLQIKIAELDQEGPTPDLPSNFTEGRVALIAQLDSLRSGLEERRQKKLELQHEITDLEIAIPASILENQGTITDLQKRLGSYQKAAHDLPKITAKLNSLDAEIAKSLAPLHLPHEDTTMDRLRLSQAQEARIKALAQQKREIQEQFDGSQKEEHKLNLKIAQVQTELDQIPPPQELSALRAAVRAAHKAGEPEKEWEQLERTLKSKISKLNGEMKRLGLWSGTLENLALLAVPSLETVDRYSESFSQAEHYANDLQQQSAERQRVLEDCNRELLVLQLSGAVPTESDLEQKRGERDHEWQQLRSHWLESKPQPVADMPDGVKDQRKADDFELLIREADDLADRLRREAERVNRQATLIGLQEQTRQALADITNKRQQIEGDLAGEKNNWQELWQPLGIDPLPPREMRSWIDRQARIIQQYAQLTSDHEHEKELRERITALKTSLQAALQDLNLIIDMNGTLDAILECAESELKNREENRQRHQGLMRNCETHKLELESTRETIRQCEEKVMQWRQEWQVVLKWLPYGEDATVDEVMAGIAELRELCGKNDDAGEQRKRKLGIQRDADDFIADVKKAAATLAPEINSNDCEVIVPELYEKLNTAIEIRARRKELQKQIADIERDISRDEHLIQEDEATLNRLCQLAGTADPLQLAVVEHRAAARQEHQKRIKELEQLLIHESGGLTLSEFILQAESESSDAIPDKRTELQRQIAELEQQRTTYDTTVGSVSNQLKTMESGGQAAREAEKAQTLQAHIIANSERYLRLKLAALVLRLEIDRYRAENQDPLLQRAGVLFQRLTLGSFASLSTDFDRQDHPILVGLRPDGKSIKVDGMSSGTRDQLYLALRLASLEKYLAANEPMPFIVDDILLNFDDVRAAATLEVLSETARHTQLLFFTHHSRLVELAQKHIPGDQLIVHPLHRTQG